MCFELSSFSIAVLVSVLFISRIMLIVTIGEHKTPNDVTS